MKDVSQNIEKKRKYAREYMKKYYAKNKDRLREYHKLRGRDLYGSKPRGPKKQYTEEDRIRLHKLKDHGSRDNYLKNTYGINTEGYNTLFVSQDGRCAICEIHQSNLKHPLYVDHCHSTNQIRGLLCNKCNFAIGLFNEDIMLLDNAKQYLKQARFINL